MKKTSKIIKTEKEELRAMSDKKLVQWYKDYRYDLENFLSIGSYENWYLGLIEKELDRRGL